MIKELRRSKEWYSVKRKKRFKIFINEFRRESLQKLQNCDWYTLKEFEKICRDFTELTIVNENINIEGRHFHGIHIDHIYPIRLGWKNKLSPYLIGMSCNLQRLSREDNHKKGNKYFLLTS